MSRLWLPLVVLLGAALMGCAPHGASGTAATPTSASTSASTGAQARASASGSCPAPSPNAPGAAQSHLPVRALCALPLQAAQVWQSIATGGRLTYSRDGIVFNNAERRLPSENRGYYHEYTVPTPGAKTRGARRLITGQDHELYYTGDHYNSFVVVDPTATGSP
jgi:guanyl-specific ribonuclease Sa